MKLFKKYDVILNIILIITSILFIYPGKYNSQVLAETINNDNIIFVQQKYINEAIDNYIPEVQVSISEYKSLGKFITTGYCHCKICCNKADGITASGNIVKPNHTIAADISILPLGTEVIIDGIVYTVEDTGSKVKGNKIDIYYSSHSEAKLHGRQEKEVYVNGE